MQADPGELLADPEVLQCQLDPSLQVDHVDRGYGDGELYRPKPLELVAPGKALRRFGGFEFCGRATGGSVTVQARRHGDPLGGGRISPSGHCFGA